MDDERHPAELDIDLSFGFLPWKADFRRWRKMSKRILRMTPKALRPLVAESLLARTPSLPDDLVEFGMDRVPWAATEQEVRGRMGLRSSGRNPVWPPNSTTGYVKVTYNPRVPFNAEFGEPGFAHAGDLLHAVGMRDAEV